MGAIDSSVLSNQINFEPPYVKKVPHAISLKLPSEFYNFTQYSFFFLALLQLTSTLDFHKSTE